MAYIPRLTEAPKHSSQIKANLIKSESTKKVRLIEPVNTLINSLKIQTLTVSGYMNRYLSLKNVYK